MWQKIVWMGLVLSLVSVVSASAQVVNPTTAVFTASTDHSTVQNGVVLVDGYSLDIMLGNATGALALSISLGKPVPAANNEITANVGGSFAKLLSGTYVATVVAVGPGGSARSVPSDPFVRLGVPVPPGKPSFR